MRKFLYVLAVCCIVGIAVSYAVARANRTEEGLGISIFCMIAMAWLFAILDVAVLILCGKRLMLVGKKFGGLFRHETMSAAAAVLLFLILALAVSAFLFTTCGVAVSRMG